MPALYLVLRAVRFRFYYVIVRRIVIEVVVLRKVGVLELDAYSRARRLLYTVIMRGYKNTEFSLGDRSPHSVFDHIPDAFKGPAWASFTHDDELALTFQRAYSPS